MQLNLLATDWPSELNSYAFLLNSKPGSDDLPNFSFCKKEEHRDLLIRQTYSRLPGMPQDGFYAGTNRRHIVQYPNNRSFWIESHKLFSEER
jgi:hypothetical protein